jgi:hypothetical protein
VTPEESTHVNTFTGTTSSFSRTASRKLAVVAVVRQTGAVSTADRTTRDPGQPGVRLRLYADLRQALPGPDTAGAETPSTQ